jgi:hypothetical protein
MTESIVLVTTGDDINIAKSTECPVSGVNRTKTFHVKHFGTIFLSRALKASYSCQRGIGTIAQNSWISAAGPTAHGAGLASG